GHARTHDDGYAGANGDWYARVHDADAYDPHEYAGDDANSGHDAAHDAAQSPGHHISNARDDADYHADDYPHDNADIHPHTGGASVHQPIGLGEAAQREFGNESLCEFVVGKWRLG